MESDVFCKTVLGFFKIVLFLRDHHFFICGLLKFDTIQDEPFWDCSQMGGEGGGQKSPLSKICHTYATIMKLGIVILYLKKIQNI